MNSVPNDALCKMFFYVFDAVPVDYRKKLAKLEEGEDPFDNLVKTTQNLRLVCGKWNDLLTRGYFQKDFTERFLKKHFLDRPTSKLHGYLTRDLFSKVDAQDIESCKRWIDDYNNQQLYQHPVPPYPPNEHHIRHPPVETRGLEYTSSEKLKELREEYVIPKFEGNIEKVFKLPQAEFQKIAAEKDKPFIKPRGHYLHPNGTEQPIELQTANINNYIRIDWNIED